MTRSPSPNTAQQIARQLRERFLADCVDGMEGIGAAVQERLSACLDEPVNARAIQLRRDAWMAFKDCRQPWLEATAKVWRHALDPVGTAKPQNSKSNKLELVDTDVVETKILASRMVMAVMEKVNAPFDDLRVRMRVLEGSEDLPEMDLLRPDVLVLMMVEQWGSAGMPEHSWSLVSEVVLHGLIAPLRSAYERANAMLVQHGVLPTIELQDRVRAPVRSATPAPSAGAAAPKAAAQPPRPPAPTPAPRHEPPGDEAGTPDPGPAPAPGGFFGGRLGWGQSEAPAQSPAAASAATATPFWKQSSGSHSGYAPGMGAVASPSDAATLTPLARARNRAQGMIGQIRRMFVNYAGGDFVTAPRQGPSPGLAAALAQQNLAQTRYTRDGTRYEDYGQAGVVQMAGELRQRTAQLKEKAETKSEKAIIEIVALMFQAILTEERIPPGIRVWFARLQMPVLRVALEDPEFLGTVTHPARMLIDRMGSCVMGFDEAGMQGHAMELEIKRIVQVIEQYPETGKKVYQVVFEEFKKFLASFLSEKGPTKAVVSVAQQVEQKETLVIQYTIELRNTMKGIPVPDEIRNYLFKVWAEVLAVASVRHGHRHAETLLLKKTASDLVWAASAKPERNERAKVIQVLPDLLTRLRSGMSLLGLAPSEQDAHLKTVSDTLADAFLSKTQAIPQSQIDALALRLGHLEDFISDDGVGDLPLDAESIEMMLGIDASAIEVVANGGSKPTAAMQAWARELQIGSWHTLDHNGQITQVQFVWCSSRKHLNLFASTAGKSHLIQAGRLAAYLQAGLLLPQEEESLTVRATRDALNKLEANPERLLA